MPYVDHAGLSRFDGKLKDFASSGFAGLDMANWQKTDAAGAVSFSPVPEMPLDPVVNFLFTESGPASGTKGPDNPSTVTGVSSVKVTRCGKNIIESSASTITVNHVTFTANGDGSYTANGTATANADFYLRFSASGLLLKGGATYTLSGCPSGGDSGGYRIILAGGSYVADTGSTATFSVESDAKYACYIRVYSGYTVSNLVFKPQLELGSAATAFEPYAGTDYTIALGNTYYGGTLDVASGILTVTWWGYVFDGTENWVDSLTHGTYYRYSLPIKPNKNTTDIACTHFIRVNNLDYEIQHYIIFSNGISIFATQTTVDDFKAWLASQYAGGTPVVACYALATPQIVQLTPQQIFSLSQPDPYAPRINTVYSDQVSVQVGYPKSPQATQNELTNAIVSLGGNV